jgi:hypothetical protein
MRQPLAARLSILAMAIALLLYDWHPIAGKKW